MMDQVQTLKAALTQRMHQYGVEQQNIDHCMVIYLTGILRELAQNHPNVSTFLEERERIVTQDIARMMEVTSDSN